MLKIIFSLGFISLISNPALGGQACPDLRGIYIWAELDPKGYLLEYQAFNPLIDLRVILTVKQNNCDTISIGFSEFGKGITNFVSKPVITFVRKGLEASCESEKCGIFDVSNKGFTIHGAYRNEGLSPLAHCGFDEVTWSKDANGSLTQSFITNNYFLVDIPGWRCIKGQPTQFSLAPLPI